ncbi:hypothetical protein N7494_008880 [Penicillium frequentans]|uniref:Uncharacterized protein n=1 Tax=Penicillium frequentans TaxID=3151616 RepID=A0AAD6CNU4_9EURO|nr:hypothetical protein N7494_008880 [Penicillium glabrum]
MADNLRDGTACITGAASGIGRATSLAFARDGCRKLVLGDLSSAGLNETRTMILQMYPTAKVVTCVMDVANVEQVESFHATAVEKFGRIDFTANIAGYGHLPTPSVELKSSEISKSFAVNLKGVFLCEQAQIRQMLKQSPLDGFESRGSIVNVASLCATIAMPGMTGYSATKGGALGLTRGDALDYGPHQIRVNCVAPGNIITPMLSGVMGEEHMAIMAGITPLRRLGRPDDIANAVVWLSSPMACYLTGVNLPVDGGLALSTGPF